MVLQAKDIMDRTILTADEETDALTVSQRMVAARKGYAILTRGPQSALAGIVTEWDFLQKIIAAGVPPASVPVKSIGSGDVQACGPETPTDEVVTMMAQRGIRRIVVRSGDRVVGVITSRHVVSIFREYVDKLTAQIAGFQVGANPPG